MWATDKLHRLGSSFNVIAPMPLFSQFDMCVVVTWFECRHVLMAYIYIYILEITVCMESKSKLYKISPNRFVNHIKGELNNKLRNCHQGDVIVVLALHMTKANVKMQETNVWIYSRYINYDLLGWFCMGHAFISCYQKYIQNNVHFSKVLVYSVTYSHHPMCMTNGFWIM